MSIAESDTELEIIDFPSRNTPDSAGAAEVQQINTSTEYLNSLSVEKAEAPRRGENSTQRTDKELNIKTNCMKVVRE